MCKWLKIGPFELTGSHSKGELQNWLTRAQSETGMQDYFNELLTTGELNKLISLLKKEPKRQCRRKRWILGIGKSIRDFAKRLGRFWVNTVIKPHGIHHFHTG